MKRNIILLLLCCGFCQSAGAQESTLRTQGAALVLKVPRFAEAQKQLAQQVKAHEGTITETHTTLAEKGRRHGVVRLTVPTAKFPTFLDAVRQVGVVSGERLTTIDRWAEAEELTRRATRSEMHQKRLNNLLQSSRRLRGSDILYVEDRLVRAENDQDSLLLQREKIQRAAQSVRMSVVLFEPYPTPPARILHPRRDALLPWVPKILAWGGAVAVGGFLWRRLRKPI